MSHLWAVLNLWEHFRVERSMVTKALGASCRGASAELRAVHLGFEGWVACDGVEDTVGAQWPLVRALFGQCSCRQRRTSQTPRWDRRALGRAFYWPERPADWTRLWTLPHPVDEAGRVSFLFPFFLYLMTRIIFPIHKHTQTHVLFNTILPSRIWQSIDLRSF